MLINFYQLKKMSEALQSYDAEKVQTKVKKPEDAGTYTVEELFSKTAGDIQDVKDHLDNFKAKKIHSTVRLELQIADGKAAIPEDLATRIPELDLETKLPACTTDNALIVNENGEQLMVDLKTGALNGTPSVKDEEATAKSEDGKNVYKPLAVTSLKVFPVGAWTLETLPTTDLIGKEEIQALSYGSAVGKIVEGITHDKSLVESIKEKVGPEIIEGALAKKADLTDVYAIADDGTRTKLYRTNDTKIARKDLDADLVDIVAGEEQLQKDVKVIQDSYDASRVLVSNTKDDGTRYSAEEVLAHKFLVRKKAVIEDLTKTKRRDIFGDDFGKVKKDVVKVYDEDLHLLYTKNSDPLELNLETGELSGPAYKLDEEEYLKHKTAFYTEYSGKACIFPQMETTLLELASVISEDAPAKNEVPDIREKSRIDINSTAAWEFGHDYHVDDIVVSSGKTYICKKRHVSTNAFNEKYWIPLAENQTVFSYSPEYSQAEKKDVKASAEAPVKFTIPVKDDGVFCFQPVDVLRKASMTESGTRKESILVPDAGTNAVVKPLAMFSAEDIESITSISAETETAGTSKVMLAVTNDNAVFKAYDKETKTWKDVDVSTADAFLASAMDASAIAEIPAEAWKAVNTTKKLGFAYLLHQEEKAAAEDGTKPAPDACKLGDLTITADIQLPDYWKHAVCGVDYDYEYHVGGSLVVRFLKDGDYKVNYDSGYQRGE